MVRHSSKLGFGLSSIAGSGNFSYQQRLIKTAISYGITHFDVAPLYGSGDAEKILGDILATCPEKVTITTKYGLFPMNAGKLSGMMRSALRPVFRRVGMLKRMASSVVGKAHNPKPVKFERGHLTASLDNSLIKLKRPVDIFLLHDPDITMATDEGLIDELSKARESGKAIHTGISGSAETLVAAVTSFPETYRVAQLENSLTSGAPISELLGERTNVITHRAIQGGLKPLLFLIEKRPGFKNIWLRETGIDPTADNLAQVLLEIALYENPAGIVLFSTTQIERIGKSAKALTHPLLNEEMCKKIRPLFNEIYIRP